MDSFVSLLIAAADEISSSVNGDDGCAGKLFHEERHSGAGSNSTQSGSLLSLLSFDSIFEVKGVFHGTLARCCEDADPLVQPSPRLQ